MDQQPFKPNPRTSSTGASAGYTPASVDGMVPRTAQPLTRPQPPAHASSLHAKITDLEQALSELKRLSVDQTGSIPFTNTHPAPAGSTITPSPTPPVPNQPVFDENKPLDQFQSNTDVTSAISTAESRDSLEAPSDTQFVSANGTSVNPSLVAPTPTTIYGGQNSFIASHGRKKVIGVVTGMVAGLVLISSFLVYTVTKKDNTTADSTRSIISIPTDDLLKVSSGSLNEAGTIQINGPLKVTSSFAITPSNAPTNATKGQLYFDQNTNSFNYYDGAKFQSLVNTQTVDGLSSLSKASAGGGLALNGNLLTNTGVTSLQGQTGALSFQAGAGIAVNGLQITNTGITGLQGNNGVIVSQSGGIATVSLPQDLSNLATPNFAGITLSSPLSVSNGGTGNTSFNNNGVLYYDQTTDKLLSTGTPGANDCLVALAGVPTFTACASGGGSTVSQIQGSSGGAAATGAITFNNASSSASAVTIDDAKAGNASTDKGIASFSSSNFSVTSGVVSIKTGGIALGTDTTGSYVAGISAGQGISTSGAGTVTIDLNLTANKGLAKDVNGLRLQNCAANEVLKYNASNQWACATDLAGNGIGAGSSTTDNKIALFTGSGSQVADSIMSQDGGATKITIAGKLDVQGDLTVTSGNSLYTSSIKELQPGSGLIVDGRTGGLSFIAPDGLGGFATFTFPTGTTGSQQICTTNITCASGGGQAVLLEPGGYQTANDNVTNHDALWIRRTAGTGALIRLQSGSSDSFVVAASGNATFGANLNVDGGVITSGTATQLGSLRLADGSSNYLTLQSSALSADLTFNLPGNYGGANACLKTDGAGNLTWDGCFGGGGGSGVASLNTFTGAVLVEAADASVTVDNSTAGHIKLSASSSPVTTTLAQAYTNFNLSPALITLNSGPKGITIQDASTPVSGSLLTVQGNSGGPKYLDVSTTGVSTTGSLIVGNDATFNGSLVTNAGATLNTAHVLGNYAAGGSIGSAATTVDIYTTFTINQTTSSQTLTLPNPTTTTAGRIVYIANIGSQPFSMHGVALANGASQSYLWNGSAWVPTNIDGTGSGVSAIGVIDSQTKSANGAVISGSNIILQTADASSVGLVSTGSQTFAGAKTFNGGISIANGGSSGLTNNGFTLNTTSSLGNYAAGGSLGASASTVDIYTAFSIAQTTASQTLSLPNPTVTTAGRLIYVLNVGSASFSMHGVNISAGNAQSYIWKGTAWVPTSIDGAGTGVTAIGTIDTQTKSSNGAVISGNNIILQTADASSVGLVSTTTQTFAGDKTFNGVLTVASGYGSVNNGYTLNTATSLGNYAAGGSIGSAAATVNIYTTFNITQTTAGQTLSLPAPTPATGGRLVYVVNVGTTSFIMHGVTIASGGAQSYIWNGSAWVATNIDGSGNGISAIGTIDSQTKSTNGAVINGNQLVLQTADASFAGLVSTGSQTFAGNKTFNGTITVATGQGITNAGYTLHTATSLGNYAAGGSLGSAATTVDIYTTFNINQTTALQTISLPNPTTATAGRLIYVANVGSTAFTMAGVTISNGGAQSFLWNGTAWIAGNIDGSGAGVTAIGAINSQTKSANGAVISGNQIVLQTADATSVGLVSTGAQTLAGAKTFSSLITGQAGLSVTGAANALSGGALTLNDSSNFTTSINTGTSTGAVSIGNNTGNTAVNIDSGTSTINIGTGAQARTTNIATGAASQIVNIGSATGASPLTIQSGTSGTVLSATSTTTNGLSVTANALTTGNGMNISTNSANLTSGNLVNVSQASTYTSNTTVSGSTVGVGRSVVAGAVLTLESTSAPVQGSGLVPSTSSWSHTVGNQNNRALVVTISVYSSSGCTVTYGGTPLTLATTAVNNQPRIYVYILTNPTPGIATVSTSCTSNPTYAQSTSWYNVDQSTPYVAVTSNPSSITAATNVGDALIGVLAGATSPPSGGATPGYACTLYASGSVYACSSYKIATTGSTNITYNTGSTVWPVVGGIVLKQVPSTALSITGPVANISSNCTVVSGTCTDSSNILNLNQQYASATGAVLKLQNSGTGADIQFGSGILRTTADSTTALRVQNAAGTGNNVLVVDTSNRRLGINLAGAPSYTVDAGGDINTTGIYRVSGVQISTANLSDSANIALLNASNTFTGTTNTFNSGVTTTNGIALNANSLTSGNAMSINTSSASLTTGNVLSVNQTSTYTATNTVSGSVVSGVRGVTAPTVLPVTLDGVGAGSGNNTTTFGVTVSSNNNRALVVSAGAWFNSGGTFPSCSASYGAQGMTSLSYQVNNGGTTSWGEHIFGLVNPIAGVNSVTVTCTTVFQMNAEASSWYNVDVTGGNVTAFAGVTGGTGTSNSVSLSVAGTTTRDVVVDSLDWFWTLTPGAGQTSYGPTTNAYNVASYKTGAAGSTGVSWTSSNNDRYAYSAVAVKAIPPQTLTLTGPVANFSSNCTVTSGTCTDSSNVLNLQQSYASATGAVARIQNAGTGAGLLVQNGSSVTALQVNTQNLTGTANVANAVLKVVQDSGTNRSINASGTINASGADYAEWIPWTGTKPSQGSIVKYHGQDMVVSSETTAGFIGNDAISDQANAILVTFTGQVPVRVTGNVSAGDYLVPNGDGTAKAISPSTATLTDYVTRVATALESNTNPTGTVLSLVSGPGSSNTFNTTANPQSTTTFADLNITGTLTTNTLVVTGNATFQGNLTVNGHIISGGNTPTITTAIPGATVSINGNDTAGTITITTGATGATAGDVVEVGFEKVFGKEPRILITGQDEQTVNAKIYPNVKSTLGYKLGATYSLTPNTTYVLDYLTVE